MDETEFVSPRSLVYVANFIDHGFAFNAQHWNFSDDPSQGIYARREVYSAVSEIESFEPWLSRIESMSTDGLDDAYRTIPSDWYGREFDALKSLLERLYNRQSRTADLLHKARTLSPSPFPNWSASMAKGVGR